MTTPRLFLVLCFGCFTAIASAVEPNGELDVNVAKGLIADVLDTREAGINIANIVEGSKQTKDGFEYRDVRRVTAVLPIMVDGKLVRLARCYDFFWSEEYGWFHQETIEARGGDEVWIWSQKKGEVVIK